MYKFCGLATTQFDLLHWWAACGCIHVASLDKHCSVHHNLLIRIVNFDYNSAPSVWWIRRHSICSSPWTTFVVARFTSNLLPIFFHPFLYMSHKTSLYKNPEKTICFRFSSRSIWSWSLVATIMFNDQQSLMASVCQSVSQNWSIVDNKLTLICILTQQRLVTVSVHNTQVIIYSGKISIFDDKSAM